MAGPRIVQVDAFTDQPFAGNPAAVCVLPQEPSPRWMQAVAREMNLSETAFVVPLGPPGLFGLRWFTPTVEVDLCGHATLASAHVLWEDGHLHPDLAATFHTRSGPLQAKQGQGGWIHLEFPSTPVEESIDPAPLEEALGVPVRFAGRSRFDLLAEVDDEDTLRALAPNMARLGELPARGIIVTSRTTRTEADFVSRWFGPQSGVDEDPVTGSAHCTLGPYWASILGRKSLTGRQISARGGEVRVLVSGDRTMLQGQAVTALRGELSDRFAPG